MKYFFSAALLFFLFGCGTSYEFSKRKYTPGIFWNNPESAECKNNSGKTEIVSEIPEIPFYNTEKMVIDFSPTSSVIKSSFVQKEKTINIFHKKAPFEDKIIALQPDSLPNRSGRYLKKAQTFSVMGVVCCLIFYPAFFVFTSLAISNANKVLRNRHATDEQKLKAKKIKERAENMLEVFLIILALYIGLIVYLIYNL